MGPDDSAGGAARSPARRLSSPTGFRIDVGSRWIRDAQILCDGATRAPVSPDLLKSAIDVVIAGQNATVEVPDEPVLPFLRALCEARVSVCCDGHARAVAGFHDSPWQVCMHRVSDTQVQVSVIETVSPGRVAISRQAVTCDQLRRGLERCVADCAAAAGNLPKAPLRDGVLSVLSDCRGLIEVPDRPYRGPAAEPRGGTVEVRTPLSSNVSVHTLVHTSVLMSVWSDDHGDDAELLAAEGVFSIDVGDGSQMEYPCHPLHLCADIVRAATRYVDTATSGYERSPLFKTAESTASVRNIGDRRLEIVIDGNPVVDLGVDIVELHRTLLIHVREVAEAVTAACPGLSVSRRIGALAVRSTRLASNTVRRRSGRFRLDPAKSDPVAGIAFERFDSTELPWSRDEIRMLAHRRTWTMRASALRSADVAELSSEHWLVRSGGTLKALRLSDGELSELPAHPDVSRARIVRSAGTALVVAPDELLIADARTDVPTLTTLVEGVAGPPRWADAAGPPGSLDWALIDEAGSPRFGVAGGARHTIDRDRRYTTCTVAEPRRAVFADAHGAIDVWDTVTGRIAWLDNAQMPLKRIRAHGEHLIAIGAHAAGSVIVVFDAESGRRLQTVGGDDTQLKAVVSEDGFAAVLGWGGSAVHLTLIDLATGELRMRTALDDAVAHGDSPQISACAGLVVVSTRDAIRGWSTRKRSAAPLWTVKSSDLAWHATPEVAECAAGPDVVVIASDEILFVSATDGRVIARTQAFWEELVHIAIDADANVTLSEQSESGLLLHRLERMGMIAVVDGVRESQA